MHILIRWLSVMAPSAVLSLTTSLALAGFEAGTRPPEHELIGTKNFLTGYPAINADHSINAVIEIPAGTTQKWETVIGGDRMQLEYNDGVPRLVKYLGYPANYGIVPQTVLAKEMGGDGDPLDVVVLGQAIARGSVVPVRPIGVLKLKDSGEIDDKIIAIVPGSDSPFDHVHSIDELSDQFAGITTILESWFANYKGPDKMKFHGFKGPRAAQELIDTSLQAFAKGLH